MNPISHLLVLSVLLCVQASAAELPAWAALSPSGTLRIAVPSPADPRFQHLGWPKALRAPDGTIVLGFLMGSKHVGENCPAVALSDDGGKTFSAPKLLREFVEGRDYGASGNMAHGLAHDGSVLLMAHGYSPESCHIFGWRVNPQTRSFTHVRRLLDLPAQSVATTRDYGYGWLVPMEGRRALFFYSHGEKEGPNHIWVLDSEL